MLAPASLLGVALNGMFYLKDIFTALQTDTILVATVSVICSHSPVVKDCTAAAWNAFEKQTAYVSFTLVLLQ